MKNTKERNKDYHFHLLQNRISPAVVAVVASIASIHFFIPGPILYSIRITCLCNVDPLTPHFYIVKVGFTGVSIIFLFLLLNIYCGYSLEPPQ